jgi:hypothetical protein
MTQAAVPRDVVRVDERAAAGCDLEQALGDTNVRTGHPARRGRHEAILVRAQIDRDVVDRKQLSNVLDRRFERVRERELCGRLPDDGKQRARAIQLERERAGALACVQRMRRADGEGRQPLELRRARRVSRREEELKHPVGGLPERKGRREATAAG